MQGYTASFNFQEETKPEAKKDKEAEVMRTKKKQLGLLKNLALKK